MTGYSQAMDKWLVLVLATCTGASAWAQPAPSPPDQERAQVSRQQRRQELRDDVSSASRRTEPVPPTAQAARDGHQMTSQARAEMREQLRRFQPVSAPRPHP